MQVSHIHLDCCFLVCVCVFLRRYVCGILHVCACVLRVRVLQCCRPHVWAHINKLVNCCLFLNVKIFIKYIIQIYPCE